MSASMRDYLDRTFEGGSAFPATFRLHPDDDGNEVEACMPGMTLRDYFAGQAMVGFCSRESLGPEVVRALDKEGEVHLGRMAYRAADAMLEAREES